MNSIIVRLVLASFIFYSAFALNEILRIYVIASFLCVFITVRKSRVKTYSVFCAGLVSLFLYLAIRTVIGFNEKALNYGAAHFYIFVFTPVACVALVEGCRTDKIIEFLNYLLFFLSFSGLVFWLSLEVVGVDLEAIIPGAIERSNDLITGDRIAIFSGEPTYLGMYMCSLGLLPFLKSTHEPIELSLKVIAFLFVIFVSKSAAFFGACFVAVLSTLCFIFFHRLIKLRLPKRVVGLGVLFVPLIFGGAVVVGPDLYLKVFLLDENSGNGRVEVWLMALAAIQDEVWFGNGLGAMALGYGSFLSYFLQLIYDGGAVALVMFLLVFAAVYFRVIFSSLGIMTRTILGVGIMAPLIFLATNASFFYPVYIFTSVFALKILAEARERERESLFSQ